MGRARRQRIGFGHFEQQPVGENAARMHQRESAVAQGFGIDFTAQKAVIVAAQRGDDELRGVFEIAALRLEMVRPDVHALRPDDPRQETHTSVILSRFQAGHADAHACTYDEAHGAQRGMCFSVNLMCLSVKKGGGHVFERKKGLLACA